MNTRLTNKLNALLLLVAAAFDASAESQQPSALSKITFSKQQLEISVEIAASQEQRELGLMHRTTLGKNHGMLFTYPDTALRRVWMKSTLLPLDILFLADDGHIVSMLDNLQPCTGDPCPIYDSKVPAMYMLELNAGFIHKNHLEIGQALLLPK